MTPRLLHIFRNTPFGREIFLQSLYFCRVLDLKLHVHIPKEKQFLFYFEHDAVQVDLDDSFLRNPETAPGHLQEILEEHGTTAEPVTIDERSASTLPDLPTDFEFMCCPRSISDLSSKIGLGFIGSRVRRILKAASFPVLIPSQVFKPWQSVMIFFGGSSNSLKALRLALKIAQVSGKPLDMFTQAEKGDREYYRSLIENANLGSESENTLRKWYFYEKGDLEDNLYDVPHDALIVLGAYGHGLIKDIMLGSKMELMQSTLPNSMLIVGPNFKLML